MKPLYILVEGQTEEEFVKNSLRPHFFDFSLYDIHPIKISTKASFKGGFVKYEHLKRDAQIYLKQRTDTIVSTFVDYFRIPNSLPSYDRCQEIHDVELRIECLEQAMKDDIGNERFFPYIQKHEFEALLFSSNRGFEYCFSENEAHETRKIIEAYKNPEDINDLPTTSPSNRLKTIRPIYNKVLEGNIIALEVGLSSMLEKCPRFANWVENLIGLVQN